MTHNVLNFFKEILECFKYLPAFFKYSNKALFYYENIFKTHTHTCVCIHILFSTFRKKKTLL
jgi:hypothetical protein